MGPVVFIGHSHVRAYARAAQALAQAGRPLPVATLLMKDPRYLPNTIPGEDGPSLNGALREAIGKLVTERTRVFSCVGGNCHNIVGLMQHPVPFDFVLPEKPDIALEPDAQLIPSALIERFIRKRVANEKAMLQALATLIPGIVHIESPPPVRDGEFVLRSADKYFRDLDIEKYGVTAASVRYKLWRVHSNIIRGFCEEIGIGFFQTPAAAVDDDGFMSSRGLIDATHGNGWYGHTIISSIERASRQAEG